MNAKKQRFTCDLSIDADSGLAAVTEFLSQTPHKRAKLEMALISFFLPEVLFNQDLSPEQEWLLRNAIYTLEKQLKLYEQFYSLNGNSHQEQKLRRSIPQITEAVEEVSQVSHQLSQLDLDDDDDFNDAGI